MFELVQGLLIIGGITASLVLIAVVAAKREDREAAQAHVASREELRRAS